MAAGICTNWIEVSQHDDKNIDNKGRCSYHLNIGLVLHDNYEMVIKLSTILGIFSGSIRGVQGL